MRFLMLRLFQVLKCRPDKSGRYPLPNHEGNHEPVAWRACRSYQLRGRIAMRPYLITVTSIKGAAMGIIPTDSLRISDLPEPEATSDKIFDFARTFNGYEWAGGALECGDLANSTREGYESSPSHQVPGLALDELQACLFFEWRRFHHFGEWPQGAELLYIRALVNSIRDGLSARGAGGADLDS